MIKCIAHICLNVRNLQRSLAFYCDTLGLEKAFEFKRDDGTVFGAYVIVGQRNFIEIFERDLGDYENSGSYSHLALEVDDLHKTVDMLRAKGLETTKPFYAPDNAWQAWITDPDGNKIELHCYTPESWQTPFATKY